MHAINLLFGNINRLTQWEATARSVSAFVASIYLRRAVSGISAPSARGTPFAMVRELSMWPKSTFPGTKQTMAYIDCASATVALVVYAARQIHILICLHFLDSSIVSAVRVFGYYLCVCAFDWSNMSLMRVLRWSSSPISRARLCCVQRREWRPPHGRLRVRH